MTFDRALVKQSSPEIDNKESEPNRVFSIRKYMAKREILIAPDKRLKSKAIEIDVIDDSLLCLIDDLLETMYDARGIGLAGPQIAILKRIIVIDVDYTHSDRNPLVLINPKIFWTSQEMSQSSEGCLSLPDIQVDVTRPAALGVVYLDVHNTLQEIEAHDLLARCVQHEIDHLNGILIVDYLSSLRRNMILQKMEKDKRKNCLSDIES